MFLFALLLRLGWCTLATVTPISDCKGYDELARNWLQTGEFHYRQGHAWRTPAYPGFLAGVYAVLGEDVRAAALAQALLGACSAALVVVLAAQVVSPRASLLAGLLLAIWPTAIIYTPVLITENLTVPLLLALLVTVACTQRANGRRAIALAVGAGLLLGLLLLTRPSNCFVAPALLFLLCRDFARRKWRLAVPLTFVVCGLLTIAPWLIRNHRIGFGVFTLSTQGGMSMWWGNNSQTRDGAGPPPRFPKETAELNEHERDQFYRGKVLAWMREHPARYLGLCGVRAVRFLGKEPDKFAAKFGWPTPASDLAVMKRHEAITYGDTRPTELTEYARAIEERHKRHEQGLRLVVAPLMLLAFVASFYRWRNFALINLPALMCLVGLSLTAFVERYRAVTDPLFIILLAALLCDIVFGTRELGGGNGWRVVKAVLAIAVVAASVYVDRTGVDKNWYRLGPVPRPQTAPADTQRSTAQRMPATMRSGSSARTMSGDIPDWASASQSGCVAEGHV